MPTAAIHGIELYYETRGSGLPVLSIQGATGDGGYFDRIADLLANEFTTVTYDRRGNSRSPAPVGWMHTSIEEQAEDAAGLLTALGLKAAIVFGTSGGGAIGLELVRRARESGQSLSLRRHVFPPSSPKCNRSTNAAFAGAKAFAFMSLHFCALKRLVPKGNLTDKEERAKKRRHLQRPGYGLDPS